MTGDEEHQAMPQCFAQLSDPHLSSLKGVRGRDLFSKRGLGYLSWRRKRRFEHRTEVLEALQRDLELSELDQLLVTGDLTHIGLPQEFEQARQWLQELGNPGQIALVPGNHDACVAAPWSETFALWQGYMASDNDHNTAEETVNFPSLRVREGIAFIGLSSACPTPPLMATGTIDSEQLNRLPALLQRTADAGLFRVVYLHHCPIAGKEKTGPVGGTWRRNGFARTRAPRTLQRTTDSPWQLAHYRCPIGLCSGTARGRYRPLQPLSNRTHWRRLAGKHRFATLPA